MTNERTPRSRTNAPDADARLTHMIKTTERALMDVETMAVLLRELMGELRDEIGQGVANVPR